MGRPFITEHIHPDEWMKSRQGHRFEAAAHPSSDKKCSIFFEASGLLVVMACFSTVQITTVQITSRRICACLRPLGGQASRGRIATVKPVSSIQLFSMFISAMKDGAAYPTAPETETNWF
jgi:hypothetical protein